MSWIYLKAETREIVIWIYILIEVLGWVASLIFSQTTILSVARWLLLLERWLLLRWLILTHNFSLISKVKVYLVLVKCFVCHLYDILWLCYHHFAVRHLIIVCWSNWWQRMIAWVVASLWLILVCYRRLLIFSSFSSQIIKQLLN